MLMAQSFAQPVPNLDEAARGSYAEYTPASCEAMLDIKYDFKQAFHHSFSPARTMAEYGIVRDFSGQSAEDRKLGIAVVDFLRQFGFATRNQLRQMLQLRDIEPQNLDVVLTHYAQLRILNYFIPAAFDQIVEAEDALRIYCLDYGAIHILTHFTSTNMVTWLSTDSIRPMRLVVMCLATVRFYLSLLQCGSSVYYFRPMPDVSIGKRMIRFSADFQIRKENASGRTFILEAIRSAEFPIDWLKKVDQIEAFITSRSYLRYYEDAPVFILLAENRNIALEAAELLHRRMPDVVFRVTTDEELAKGLAEAKFWKYTPAADGKPSKLTAVRAELFSPAKSK